jgi:hypothetical protein
MLGPILHVGALVSCTHGGMAVPTAPVPTIMVSGMPIATIAAPYSIAGCGFVPPTGNGPCVLGMWIVGSLQVMSHGQPVAILSGTSTCVPTGTPLLPISAQTFVIAT